MKLLRNPIVVALLGLVALGLVLQSIWPYIHGPRRGQPAAVATAPAPAPPPAPAPAPKPSVGSTPAASTKATSTNSPVTLEKYASLPTGSDLDLNLVRQDAPRWGRGRRDPFQIRSTPTKPVYPRAMEVLTLSAIWRQTDSSLAVVNNHIYSAGDTVLRFLIKSIEPDRVWVQGPNGIEVVEFKPTYVGGTNAPAPEAGSAFSDPPHPTP